MAPAEILVQSWAMKEEEQLVKLTVGVGLPKAKRGDWLMEKLSEIGVDTKTTVAENLYLRLQAVLPQSPDEDRGRAILSKYFIQATSLQTLGSSVCSFYGGNSSNDTSSSKKYQYTCFNRSRRWIDTSRRKNSF